MPTSQTFIHGKPPEINTVAGQVDPSHIAKAKTAGERILSSNDPCPTQIPGCAALLQAEDAALGKLIAFYDSVEQGITEFQTIARESAVDYANHDEVSRQAMQRALDLLPSQLTDDENG